MKPLLVMLGGPNGAGKTTFYESFLSHLDLPFVNPHDIGKIVGLSAYEAAEEATLIREAMVHRGEGFITETVFSDPHGAKVEFLVSAAREGFDVQLIFIGLQSANQSRTRVRRRKECGGHDVPAKKLRDRYPRTLKNLARAVSALPRVTVYDNSSSIYPFRFVVEFRERKLVRRADGTIPLWARPLLEKPG
jgi:predicted ABC-type ATPase